MSEDFVVRAVSASGHQGRSAGLAVCILVMATLTVPVRAVDSDTAPDEVIKTLQTIKKGFEEDNPPRDLVLRGRIFRVQEAEPGKTIPKENVEGPVWLRFLYVRRGATWRYEQDWSVAPSERLVRLCDGRRIYWADSRTTEAVRNFLIAPVTDGWERDSLNYFGCFRQMTPHGNVELRFHTVGIGMDTLISLIRKRADEYVVGVERIPEGFRVTWKNRRHPEMTAIVDTRCGYNLTRSETLAVWNAGGEVRTLLEVHYKEVAPGLWLPMKGEINGNDRGVVIRTKLEIESWKDGASDYDSDWFTTRSLRLAERARIEDCTISPPLVYELGDSPERQRELLGPRLVEAIANAVDEETSRSSQIPREPSPVPPSLSTQRTLTVQPAPSNGQGAPISQPRTTDNAPETLNE